MHLTAMLWTIFHSSRPNLSATGMKLKYSISQLLNLNNCTIPTCVAAIKERGLLSRPRYIHRSSRGRFIYHQPGHSASAIPSIWTTDARLPRHQGSNTSSVLWPLKRFAISSTLKIELFYTQSLINKSSFIQDHIIDKGLDLMCITETWHQPEVYSALNEACPPDYSHLEKACSTGHGGSLAVIHWQKLELSPLSLPTLSSFECLAFKRKPPFCVTILIYWPPKPNSVFISEMHDLLTTLCTTSANIIILWDCNIHVDTPSCHFAAKFLQLLDCLNLQQHVDVPTYSRGHTLDISNSTPICNFLVYDLGVSDHNGISWSCQSPFAHTKNNRRIC